MATNHLFKSWDILNGRVRWIEFNRPEKNNMFTIDMANSFVELLDTCDEDDRVKTIILTGSDTHFCHGIDFSSIDHVDHFAAVAKKFTRRLIQFRKPIIAGVHGQVIGFGCTLLPFFDLVYAAESTQFKTPFIKLGIIPDFGASLTLPAHLGKCVASEMLLFDQTVSAIRMKELGFINDILSKDTFNLALEEKVGILMKGICPNTDLVTIKRLMNQDGGLMIQRIDDELLELTSEIERKLQSMKVTKTGAM